MKKFISMVMAAAMVASLVPATAFAAGDVAATAKVIDALDTSKVTAEDGVINETNFGTKVPELRLDITRASYRETLGSTPTVDVTVSLDNATFLTTPPAYPTTDSAIKAALLKLVHVYNDEGDEILVGGSDATPGVPAHKTFTVKNDGSENVAVADTVIATGGAGAPTKDPEVVIARADFTEKTGWDALLAQSKKDPTKKFSVKNSTAGTITVTKAEDDSNVVIVAAGATDFTGFAPLTEATLLEGLANGTYEIAVTNAGDFLFGNVDLGVLTAGTAPTTVTGFAPYTQLDQFKDAATAKGGLQLGVLNDVAAADGTGATPGVVTSVKEYSLDRNDRVEEVTFTFTGRFAKDWFVIVDLESTMDKNGQGKTATVSVDSDMVDASDLVYVSVLKKDISASAKKTASVAEEEMITLESDLKIKANVDEFVTNQWFELKLSKGFEFNKALDNTDYTFHGRDGSTVYMKYIGAGSDEIIIDNEDLEIESTSAKSGATCTLTIKALDKKWTSTGLETNNEAAKDDLFSATTTVEIAKVVDYKVMLTVDEDEDVPVIYSGVNVENYGITDDSDHLSLEVTAKETFPGAWSMRKGFNFELPEHVYVTDVDVIDTDNFYRDGRDAAAKQGNIEVRDVEAAFWNAYQDGSHVNFEFAKRVFDDVDSNLRDKECAEMTFQLELVADPGFEGDVVLKLTGELVDEQEVTIAKFVKPYEVKAEQNDLKIDYRYTDIPTSITLTEAEAGLWAKNEAQFRFSIEKEITFDSDPTFEIDSKSGLEIKDDKVKDGTILFTIKSESDEAATITIKDMDLFMQRNIPAGPYDLKIGSSLADRYEGQALWAPDVAGPADQEADSNSTDVSGMGIASIDDHNGDDCKEAHSGVKADSYVGCVADYSKTVKEAFINVITAGREVDDASFTTKVVVPVGENYIVAGEKQIELDTPAYINAAGYTMLPIRAVATALGISNNNVLWDQPTKTVTILYGQRIITMTQGQKVVYVNGSAIPASAAVENTNSRTFLPMRDLATALGVTDITWDQATRTATLNGNQK